MFNMATLKVILGMRKFHEGITLMNAAYECDNQLDLDLTPVLAADLDNMQLKSLDVLGKLHEKIGIEPNSQYKLAVGKTSYKIDDIVRFLHDQMEKQTLLDNDKNPIYLDTKQFQNVPSIKVGNFLNIGLTDPVILWRIS